MIRRVDSKTSGDFKFKYFEFPSEEPHIQLETYDDSYSLSVICDILNFKDLGQLLLFNDALKRIGHFNKYIHYLQIPFFPCSRQDRVANFGESFSVKVFADIINSLNIDEVHIYDPHSDITPALLNNCVVHEPTEWIEEVIEDYNPDVLIAPDAGAAKKVNKIGQKFNLPVVQCGKTRDTKTGKLSGFEVHGNVNNKSCLFIDDILDGSYGLFKTSEVLKDKGATKVFAYATHGLFTKGLNENFQHVNKIWTTNTILPNEINRSGIFVDKLNIIEIIQ